MEILKATADLPSFLSGGGSSDNEVRGGGRPEDELQRAAEAIGRQNVSYDHVWDVVVKSDGLWVPVKCNTVRRAVLLASAAINNRRYVFKVWRRGRLVCVKHVEVPDSAIYDGAIAATA